MQGAGVAAAGPRQLATTLCALVALLALVGIAGAGVASSHSLLDETKPEDGAMLREAPQTVEARFSEPLRDSGRSELRVFAPDGTRADRDEPRLEGGRRAARTAA